MKPCGDDTLKACSCASPLAPIGRVHFKIVLCGVEEKDGEEKLETAGPVAGTIVLTV